MTNIELTTKLKPMVESIHADCTAWIKLRLSPKTEANLAEFEAVRARLWSTICEAIRACESVDDLSHTNETILDEIMMIRNGMVAEGHDHD